MWRVLLSLLVGNPSCEHGEPEGFEAVILSHGPLRAVEGVANANPPPKQGRSDAERLCWVNLGGGQWF